MVTFYIQAISKVRINDISIKLTIFLQSNCCTYLLYFEKFLLSYSKSVIDNCSIFLVMKCPSLSKNENNQESFINKKGLYHQNTEIPLTVSLLTASLETFRQVSISLAQNELSDSVFIHF